MSGLLLIHYPDNADGNPPFYSSADRAMTQSSQRANDWRMECLPMVPDRLPGNRQYCLDKAVECDRKAAQVRDPNAAKEFQSLAARWRVAAATRDFNHKVEDILRTLREAASL